MRVLILGGTGEARALAAALHGRDGLEVISSLAGRVTDPTLPVGQVRIGGFGGVAGLSSYLRQGVDAVTVVRRNPAHRSGRAGDLRGASRRS